ncbi:MAG TPA: copper chaperone PCu(A)C [Rhizobacter sp.]|nr:copper chaperone PCu(A)C [Rhizobacter sp.]
MKLTSLLATVALSAATVLSHAHSFQLGAISIGHPYARATTAAQPTGGAYLTLTNKGADDRLLSASADVAKSVELHRMTMEGDVMHMRRLDAVDVPAGQTVELKPGALHVMLVGLKAPLQQGDHFPMTLKFEKAGEVTVQVNVEAADAMHDMKHGM